MSELKAGVITTPHNEAMSFERGSDVIAVTEGETEFYLKSEADEVIAELEQKLDEYRYTIAVLRKECSHHKYRRSLSIAKLCEASQDQFPFFGALSKEEKFWQKWHDRWFELAEKFKPIK